MAKTDFRVMGPRFLEKVDRDPGEFPGGCWRWTGPRFNSGGYGRAQLNGRSELAHRVMYQLVRGEIPKGLFVLHSCDNPNCVNPSHLHVGSHADNMKERSVRNRFVNPKLPHKDSISGILGVTRHARGGFMAELMRKGKRWRRLCKTKEEAEIQVQAWREQQCP